MSINLEFEMLPSALCTLGCEDSACGVELELVTLLLDLCWSMVFRKLSCALPEDTSEPLFVRESLFLDFPALSLEDKSEQTMSRGERRREKREREREGEEEEEEGEDSATVWSLTQQPFCRTCMKHNTRFKKKCFLVILANHTWGRGKGARSPGRLPQQMCTGGPVEGRPPRAGWGWW